VTSVAILPQRQIVNSAAKSSVRRTMTSARIGVTASTPEWETEI
jgi:hypothetical protein